jgi:hypothetical protein
VKVQPPHRHHTRRDAAQQVLDRLASLGIAQRAHDAARLVQDQVHEGLGHDAAAVDLDSLTARVGANA